MSQVGYYRYKIDNYLEGTYEINIYKNGNVGATHTLIIKKRCSTEKLIKYLDHNGQFRFYPFNSRYETTNKPQLIGKASKFITSILTSQSSQSNIGYKNERVLSLVADNVSNDELEYLQDIWDSPRVYLYKGENTSDELKDWLEVTVVGGDNISKRRKLENGKINIDIQLPEWYSITML